MGMEMSDITRKCLLNNKVEVTTYSINDENMKKCPQTHIHTHTHTHTHIHTRACACAHA
jgi:hypothetical protein